MNDLDNRPQRDHAFVLAALAAALIGGALASLPVQARERHTTATGPTGLTSPARHDRIGGNTPPACW